MQRGYNNSYLYSSFFTLHFSFPLHFLPHIVLNQTLLLTGEKTIFWEEQKCLILSDLHLGKSGHFRNNGIGVPNAVMQEDMQRLAHQISFFKPGTIIIVGDLFHSRDNAEHRLFEKWRKDLSTADFILVKGNHDILPASWYQENGIHVRDEMMEMGDFIFTHQLIEETPPGKYGFTGHIHPGITLKGWGRQSLGFPCFWFGKDHAILPAFGRFTGKVNIEPLRGDKVFALTGKEVVCVSG